MMASPEDERNKRLRPGYNPSIPSAARRRRELRESGRLYSMFDKHGEELDFEEIDAGKNGRGAPVTYAYTERQNEHGYFLSFRIVYLKTSDPKRHDFSAVRQVQLAKRRAEDLAAKYKKGESSSAPRRG